MAGKSARVRNSEFVGSTNGAEAQEVRTRRFGVFELDLRAGELRRSGLKVKLQEQPFQVLTLLLEKPGEVVTRDDLRQRLWPADTFVDFDHSLNAAIKRLRDALGDSAENPTFVETVARRGYRFLAPVSTTLASGNGAIAPQAPGAGAAVAASMEKPAWHFHLWWIAAGLGAVVLLLLGIKLGLSLAQHHSAAQLQPRITRLTANPADDRVRAAAISQDGRYLAFSDETGFYLRQIDTGETHPIEMPKDFVAGTIGWFPDSAHMVVALTGPSQTTSLWEISALGGSPRKLLDGGVAPAVSPDGKQIAFITAGRMRGEIWLMAADGEQPRKLVGQEGDFFGALAWSPDGARIAYTRGKFHHTYGLIGEIGVVDLRDQHLSSVLQIDRLGWFSRVDGPLAWTADSRLIYAIGEPPPRQLDSNVWSVAIEPTGHPIGSPVRLTNDSGAVTSISASGDGKRTVYVKSAPQPDVYVAKIERSALASEPIRLTLDDRQDIPFDWTPDSKAVFFSSDRSGTFNIYRQDIDRTVPERVVAGNKPLLGPRLNPEGTQLLYLAYPDLFDNASPVSLMRMSLAGGAPEQVLQRSLIVNQQCARAPANLCLYSYYGDDKLTFMSYDPLKGDGTQLYQITNDLPQFYNWSLSPDGSTLAIGKWTGAAEEPRIRLVSLTGGREKWLTIQGLTGSGVTGLGSFDWAADSKSLWITSVGEDQNALVNVDLQGRAHVAWRPNKMTVYWAIPSRDGRYLALHVGSTSANAWMLERPLAERRGVVETGLVGPRIAHLAS